MPKILSYILPLIAAFFALIPPIDFKIEEPNKDVWPLMIVCTAFLGIRILFIRTNIIVKAIPVLALLNCFLSGIPFVSFNAYVSVVACCYFYIGLTMMDSWRPMFEMAKTLLILNGILLAMQILGHDSMLNFGRQTIEGYGVVGQHMQMGSFALVLAAFLGIINPLFYVFPLIAAIICNSSWTLFCAAVALAVGFGIRRPRLLLALMAAALACFLFMAIKTGKFAANTDESNGRSTVWAQTIKLSNDRPLRGWGISTYQHAGPVFVQVRGLPWKQAHNDFIQLDFELGHPLFLLAVIAWGWIIALLIRNLNRPGAINLLIGIVAISLDMIVHFPLRIIQCVPLLICFFAYLDKKIKYF